MKKRLYFNGTIITMELARPTASAVLISGNIIEEVLEDYDSYLTGMILRKST